MDVIYNKNNSQKIKGFLVFFCVVSIFSACRNTDRVVKPILDYENGKAVRVLFKSNKEPEEFSVYHLDNPTISILGSFSEDTEHIAFTPVLPFSKGNTFGVAYKGTQIAIFKVGNETAIEVPELEVIYPRNDTVPVNILKMYMVFSDPMQYVGNPLDFIRVFDETENVEVHPFLGLVAELWNKDHTRLTLWFDPGRIKTDLIPNKEKGLPLKEDHTYTITIDKNWKSATGISLAQSHSKTIHVIGKDVTSPRPETWSIKTPRKNTKEPLKINFHEALDAILALESIKLFKGNTALPGSLILSNTDNAVVFQPSHPWKVGDYRILVNPILEDLAGNNLQHLFDSDLGNSKTKNKIVTVLEFKVQ